MAVTRERGRPNRPSGSAQARREVRHRDRYVEAFHADTTAPLEQAYFDKISLTIPACDLSFEANGIYRGFRNHFSQNGIIIRDRSSPEPKIRDGWLFSGSIRMARSTHEMGLSDDSVTALALEYKLHINPSRFLHHLYYKLGCDPEQFTLENIQAIPLEERLRPEDIPGDELSLDLGDNYIPDGIFKTVRPFEDFTRLYIESIIELLNQSVENSMSHVLGSEPQDIDMRLCHERWVINSGEVFWEYSVIDALAFVSGLWDGFQAVLYNTEKREYRANAQIEADTGQARTGQQLINNGVAIYANDIGVQGLKLCVYAKLHDRVRFEFRYNTSILRIFSNSFNRELGNDMEGFCTALAEFKVSMRRRLRKTLTALPDLALSERAEYHVFADFLVFLGDIHREYPRTNLRDTLSTLVNNGRIVVSNDTDEHRIMERLTQDYIVESRSEGQSAYVRNDDPNTIYNLTPRYRNVIRAFREVFEDKVISNLEEERRKILQELEQLKINSEIDGNVVKQMAGLDKFFDELIMEPYRFENSSDAKKKEYLERIIDKIVVFWDEEKNEHRLEIEFLLKNFNDNLPSGGVVKSKEANVILKKKT